MEILLETTRVGLCRVVSMDKREESKTFYCQIREYISNSIDSGTFQPGQKIDSETTIAKQFGVARMTANKAINSLVNDGVLERIKGSGTYVKRRNHDYSLLEIHPIATTIAGSGKVHRSVVLSLRSISKVEAERSAPVAGVANDTSNDPFTELFRRSNLPDHLYHVEILHFSGDIPLQFESRLVNPAIAFDFIKQDFRKLTTTDYLTEVAPVEAAAFKITAQRPTTRIAQLLAIEDGGWTMTLHRITNSQGQFASISDMSHPAKSFAFSGIYQI